MCSSTYMTATQVNAATTNELLDIVLRDEKENGCSDRNKLNKINFELVKREGKTASTILTEQSR